MRGKRARARAGAVPAARTRTSASHFACMQTTVGDAPDAAGAPSSIHVRVVRLLAVDVAAASPGTFNTSNHWMDVGACARPADYDAANAACDTATWLHVLPASRQPRQFTVPVGRAMRDAARTHHLTGRRAVAPLFQDDVDAAASVADAEGVLPAVVAAGFTFLRSGSVSFKYGVHGVGPYTSAAQVYASLCTAPSDHTPLRDAGPDGRLALFAFPWLDINPDLEFRVFVRGGVVTAVSQQHWCEPNRTLATWTDTALVRLVRELVAATEAAVALLTTGDSFVVDVACAPRPVFIEVNPFGANYSSGSALFHWLRDAAVLTGAPDSVFDRTPCRTVELRVAV
jgi:hypothetical protein